MPAMEKTRTNDPVWYVLNYANIKIQNIGISG